MLRSGDVVDRYTVEEVVGEGGMGCVYRAHDNRLDRRVAIKVIPEGGASPEAKARLLREAKAAAALDHPNAVAIFDVGELDGSPYVVMELVAGRTIREAVGASSVPVPTRIDWLVAVGRALSAAHKKGLVHRDIKPENVMVRDDGVVKVLDFGIARSARGAVDPAGLTQPVPLPTLTRDGVSLGTPAYMAPEQIKGEPVDGRADQFAWGVLAYELLTGRLPWRGTDALAAAASIVTDEPDASLLAVPAVPASVRAAVLRALSKRPADRFASMDELLSALEEEPNGARPAPARAAETGAGQLSEAIAKSDHPDDDRAASSTTSRQYSSGEMRQILSRAVERQAEQPGARIAFDDLLDAAREVGVEEEVLREASREIRARAEQQPTTPSEDDIAFAAWRRRKRRGFFRHLAAYVIVNGALLVMGLIVGKPQLAAGAIFWAIGLLLHGFGALFASRDDWQEVHAKEKRRAARRRARDERRRARERQHEEVLDRVIEEGASLLLAGGRKLRQRIEKAAATGVAPGNARPRAANPATGAGAKLRFAPSEPGARVRVGADEPPPVEQADDEPDQSDRKAVARNAAEN